MQSTWKFIYFFCSLFKRRLSENLTRLLYCFIYLFIFSLWMTSVIAALCHISFLLLFFSLSDSHFVCVWVWSWNVFVFFPTNTSNQNKITVAMDDFGGVVTLTPFHSENFSTVIMVKLRVLWMWYSSAVVSNNNTYRLPRFYIFFPCEPN